MNYIMDEMIVILLHKSHVPSKEDYCLYAAFLDLLTGILLLYAR
jgi:hypothetical protein